MEGDKDSEHGHGPGPPPDPGGSPNKLDASQGHDVKAGVAPPTTASKLEPQQHQNQQQDTKSPKSTRNTPRNKGGAVSRRQSRLEAELSAKGDDNTILNPVDAIRSVNAQHTSMLYSKPHRLVPMKGFNLFKKQNPEKVSAFQQDDRESLSLDKAASEDHITATRQFLQLLRQQKHHALTVDTHSSSLQNQNRKASSLQSQPSKLLSPDDTTQAGAAFLADQMENSSTPHSSTRTSTAANLGSIASSLDGDVASPRDSDGNQGGHRRSRAPMACVECHRAKTACSEQRPCSRCVRLGKAELCQTRQHRRFGRPYRLKSNPVKVEADGSNKDVTSSSSTSSRYSNIPNPPPVQIVKGSTLNDGEESRAIIFDLSTTSSLDGQKFVKLGDKLFQLNGSTLVPIDESLEKVLQSNVERVGVTVPQEEEGSSHTKGNSSNHQRSNSNSGRGRSRGDDGRDRSRDRGRDRDSAKNQRNWGKGSEKKKRDETRSRGSHRDTQSLRSSRSSSRSMSTNSNRVSRSSSGDSQNTSSRATKHPYVKVNHPYKTRRSSFVTGNERNAMNDDDNSSIESGSGDSGSGGALERHRERGGGVFFAYKTSSELCNNPGSDGSAEESSEVASRASGGSPDDSNAEIDSSNSGNNNSNSDSDNSSPATNGSDVSDNNSSGNSDINSNSNSNSDGGNSGSGDNSGHSVASANSSTTTASSGKDSHNNHPKSKLQGHHRSSSRHKQREERERGRSNHNHKQHKQGGKRKASDRGGNGNRGKGPRQEDSAINALMNLGNLGKRFKS